MPLDSSRKFHGPQELAQLVEAVFRRDATVQETNWVEWKSQADLAAVRWLAEIGLQVVGFANRMPAVAEGKCEGFSYLLIGVEPGRAQGVTPVDPSLLQQGVAAYTGQIGPRWDPTYLTFRGVEVLVIETAPPRWGDPVWNVRKPYSGPPTIEARPYVRRHGETAPATPAELDALVERAKRSPRPAFELVWRREPGLIQRLDSERDAQERWRQMAERALISRTSGAPRAFAPLDFSAFTADGRTTDVYNAQVDDYLTAAMPKLRARALANAARMKLGRLAFDLQNLGNENYADVELELILPGALVACFEPDDLDWESDLGFPSPPRARGTTAISELAAFTPPFTSFTRVPEPIRGEVENEAGRVIVTFAAEDLRPKRRARLWSIYVMSTDPAASSEVIGHWSATSKSVSGEASGTIAVQLTPEALSVSDVVTARGAAPESRSGP